MAGDYVAALDAAIRATGLLWATSVLILRAEYELYSALTRAAVCDSEPASERRAHLAALAAHGEARGVCPGSAPKTSVTALPSSPPRSRASRDMIRRDAGSTSRRFARRATTASSTTRLSPSRSPRASTRLVARADRQGLSARRRDGFRQWGADGKVRQLEAQYPYLTHEQPASDPTHTVMTPVEHLDLSTCSKCRRRCRARQTWRS
jgi:hypothetical protein